MKAIPPRLSAGVVSDPAGRHAVAVIWAKAK